MKRRTTVLPMLLLVLAIPALIAMPLAFGAGGGRERVTEMPPHVQTEGMTYADYRAHQADLMSHLTGSSRAASLNDVIRVEISREENEASDKQPRCGGTPQQIGLVKAVTPRLDVDGLAVDSNGGGSRRGPRGRAIASPDGGFAWAVTIQSGSAGALRAHIENMNLPAGGGPSLLHPARGAVGPDLLAGPGARGGPGARTGG